MISLCLIAHRTIPEGNLEQPTIQSHVERRAGERDSKHLARNSQLRLAYPQMITTDSTIHGWV